MSFKVGDIIVVYKDKTDRGWSSYRGPRIGQVLTVREVYNASRFPATLWFDEASNGAYVEDCVLASVYNSKLFKLLQELDESGEVE